MTAGIRIVQLRVIQEIEELGAILESPALADGEQLVRREIDVEGSGTAQDIAARVAESAQRRRGKRGGVEPLRDARPSRARWCSVAWPDLVRQVVAHGGQGAVVTGRNIQRKPALPVPDAPWFPSLRTAPSSHPPGRGQLPEVIENEALWNIEIRHRAIGAHVIRIDRVHAAQVGEIRDLVDGLGETYNSRSP